MFFDSIKVYIDRPQVVNRRCGGSLKILDSKLLGTNALTTFYDDVIEYFSQRTHSVLEDRKTSISAELKNLIEKEVNTETSIQLRKLVSKLSSETYPHEIIITALVLRLGSRLNEQNQLSSPAFDLLAQDQDILCASIAIAICFRGWPLTVENEGSQSVAFIPVESQLGFLQPVGIFYKISLLPSKDDSHSLELSTRSYPQLKCKTISEQWLEKNLLPKLEHWMLNKHLTVSSGPPKPGSLGLVNVDTYYSKCKRMKDDHGKRLCKMWPECTDPLKFVYEDIAIAAYLICIWELERVRLNLTHDYRQSFVDLGCGNGLLVYILEQEGYHGYGIDTRRRKIWNLYDIPLDLREESIVPSDAHLFPDVEWLIGNHSDELTPWIPVMAARSSPACRIFLLPCCAHDFHGKFSRTNAAQSVYSQYIKYVKDLCERCGFNIKTDTLRIPSTKKICVLGERDPSLSTLSDDELQSLTAGTPGSQTTAPYASGEDNTQQNEAWSADFKPREKEERVRNCSTVAQDVKSFIISTIVSTLLKGSNVRLTSDDRNWNAGGQLTLKELVSIIPPETMIELKSECGGLKTLLKNHHHILDVLPGAKVQLADYISRPESKSPQLHKTKMCWFLENHPDGCQLSAECCRYAHHQSELRPVNHTNSSNTHT